MRFTSDRLQSQESRPFLDLINAEALRRCKPSVRIINIARGGIVDEDALLEALETNRCLGAALDVFSQEPPKEGGSSWRLIQHPRVVCTPHLGASTSEAQERVAREIAEQLIDLIRGRQAVGIVNAPNLARSMIDCNKPWMHLAQALGHLAHCLADGFFARDSGEAQVAVDLVSYGKPIANSAEIDTTNFIRKMIPDAAGEGTEDVNLLASSALVGHLNGMKVNGINIVNAAIIAGDRGLTVSALHVGTKLRPSPIVNEDMDKMLQLTVRRGSSVLQLTGTCESE